MITHIHIYTHAQPHTFLLLKSRKSESNGKIVAKILTH